MPFSTRTTDLLHHLAGRPGHDEVKSDFRDLLVAEFGVELGEVRFEQRIEVRSRTDALIGRTVFEAKSNLDREWRDVELKMPDYLRNREEVEKERFVGIASDGLKWAVFELAGDALARIKETTLDPEKAGDFIAWLDGVVALKASLPPDPLTIRLELARTRSPTAARPKNWPPSGCDSRTIPRSSSNASSGRRSSSWSMAVKSRTIRCGSSTPFLSSPGTDRRQG